MYRKPQIGISRVPWAATDFRPSIISYTKLTGNTPLFFLASAVRSGGHFELRAHRSLSLSVRTVACCATRLKFHFADISLLRPPRRIEPDDDIYQKEGRFSDAEPLYTRALKMDEKALVNANEFCMSGKHSSKNNIRSIWGAIRYTNPTPKKRRNAEHIGEA